MKTITIDDVKYNLVPVEEECIKPIGTKFRGKDCKEPVYLSQIDNIKDGQCIVSTKIERKTYHQQFPVKEVNSYFNQGIWIEVGNILNSGIQNKSEYPKILSFKGKSKGTFYDLRGSHYTDRDGGMTAFALNDMLNVGYSVKTGDFIIHSVAASKDAIFTVGDDTNYGIITGFKYDESWIGNIVVHLEDNKPVIVSWLSKKPERKPLFTTEDGKEIYEGDYFYEVFGKTHDMSWSKVHPNSVDSFIKCNKDDGRKAFSTENAAKEYIKDNKPEFSRRQIVEAYNRATGITTFFGNLGL
jgi:hypothetical protein